MKHLAIIADGNRRWAKAAGLPIRSGYLQGLVAIENCCDWCIANRVDYLTVFCFSTENWRRAAEEVNMLIGLGKWYFDDQLDWYVNRGIRVQFSGRRDRFAADLIETMERLETATAGGAELTLIVCLDYGGRDEIVRAIESGARTEEEINEYVTRLAPEPDVILRTGGDMRLSNFLLWQSAYSELLFTTTLFPDLNAVGLDHVMHEYKNRKRRFGGG